jgi:hypothetical protein
MTLGRLINAPNKSFLLLGPRDAKKTSAHFDARAAQILTQHDAAGKSGTPHDTSEPLDPEGLIQNGFVPFRASTCQTLQNRNADGVGFEPTSRFRDCRFSRPVHSTALPPIPRHGQ